MTESTLKYCIYFAQSHPNFRQHELVSVSEMLKIPIEFIDPTTNLETPFLIVGLLNDAHAKLLVERCILIKEIIRLWCSANSLEDIQADLKTYLVKSLMPASCYTESFKMLIKSWRRSTNMADQIALINSFSFLDFKGTNSTLLTNKGKVDLKNPFFTLTYYEEWDKQWDELHTTKQKIVRCYFGVLISVDSPARDLIEKYDLKKREYLGTTSMDAELSLLMANQAKVERGSLMYDPFVGTGSFPIIASHFGAYSIGTNLYLMCSGADIDGRQIRGKSVVNAGVKKPKTSSKWPAVATTKNEINHEKALSMGLKSISCNAKQYDLERRILDNLVLDFSHHPFRSSGNGWFDSIITDPPYGIRFNHHLINRAGAKTIGKSGKSVPAADKDSPSTPNLREYLSRF